MKKSPRRNFILIARCFAVCCLNLLSGCATGLHGSFIPHSYVDPLMDGEGKNLGPVSGKSSQTYFLFIFPMGDSANTHEAIEDAKRQISGTRFLSDISIDEREYWGVWYKKRVVKVDAHARD